MQGKVIWVYITARFKHSPRRYETKALTTHKTDFLDRRAIGDIGNTSGVTGKHFTAQAIFYNLARKPQLVKSLLVQANPVIT